MEIKIPAVDSLADAAKGFIQKVITPPLEELGLLFSDNVKLWRFKNQVNILNKAEKHLQNKGLKTKKVSLKVLTPLLEYSSLEEEESLQEKWSALIANTVKERSNLDSTLYSYILSQLTKDDAEIFEVVYNSCVIPAADNVFTVFVKGQNSINCSYLIDKYITIDAIVDNLIRLRLIKEVNHPPGNVCLTNLGFNFMCACTI